MDNLKFVSDPTDLLNYIEALAIVSPSLIATYFECPALSNMVYLAYALSVRHWWVNYKRKLIYQAQNPPGYLPPRCFTPPPFPRKLM